MSKKKLTKAELKAEGFYDVEKVELEVDRYNNITGVKKVLRNDIKAIHGESIDTLNEQQINTHIHYRKKGATYVLVERTKKGREYPTGHLKEGQLMPITFYQEDIEKAATEEKGAEKAAAEKKYADKKAAAENPA